MDIKKNVVYSDGYKVQIKGKSHPLIKTSLKSVYYLNSKNKEKRTNIDNVEQVFPPKKKEEKGTHNFGGHMPHPPEDCNHSRIFEHEGIRWIDNVICVKCKKKCTRWKEYNKTTKKNLK